MVEHIEAAHWLHGLLRVLDDEPLVVLHRETGKGFRLRISGIPMLDGVRVVVLDPPPYERGWTVGRNYPLMTPEVVVVERLSPQEARDLLARVAPAAATGGDEAGSMVLTDDLTLPLSGQGYDQLVDFILRELLAGEDHEVLAGEVSVRFGLSLDDAGFALERTFGGLVRARTGNLANCPPREQDPVAWQSFQSGMEDPSIIGRCLDH